MLAKTAPFLRRVAQAVFTQVGEARPVVGRRDKMVFIIFKKCNFLFKGIQTHNKVLQISIKNKQNVSASLN